MNSDKSAARLGLVGRYLAVLDLKVLNGLGQKHPLRKFFPNRRTAKKIFLMFVRTFQRPSYKIQFDPTYLNRVILNTPYFEI